MSEFNQLEILFLHKPGSDKAKSLDVLRQAVQESFSVEGCAFANDGSFSNSRQIVRLRADRSYTSAQDMEVRARELAPEDQFPWQRIGAVPVGQTQTFFC